METEALKIFKQVYGTKHPNYAASLNCLSTYNAYLGNYPEAIRLGTEALEIRKKNLGADNPDYAQSLSNLAGYYSHIGKNEWTG
jgi:tetratricopeptide (TPR) repeat protein